MTDKLKTKLVKCESCKGKKELVGLGFTVKRCPTCKGIGYQEEVIDPIGYLEEKENKIETTEIEESFDDGFKEDAKLEDHPLKKRGRKAKAK